MFRINAISKYKDLNGNPKLYFVLGISSVASISSFLFYRNFFIAIVMLASGIVSFLVLSRKPKSIPIEMTEDSFVYDGAKISWKNCIGWTLVDLDDMTEIIIQTTDVSQQFLYFYFKEDQPGVKEFILYISNHLPYLDNIQEKNVVHRFLRYFGLV